MGISWRQDKITNEEFPTEDFPNSSAVYVKHRLNERANRVKWVKIKILAISVSQKT